MLTKLAQKKVDDHEYGKKWGGQQPPPFPLLGQEKPRKHRRHHHRRCDCNAVSPRKAAGTAEANYEAGRRGQHEYPVHRRDVDLADFLGRGPNDSHRRAHPKSYTLECQ
jgi:hypothetical protein